MAWYGLGVLCLAALLSQLDRQLTTLIVGPLKSEFAISDTQFSLLHGYAFALTYAVAGLPFGMLVDRVNRRNMIFLGLLAWSGLTLASAFATSFSQLVILRIGVGIGEAVLSPAAYSMIVDYFAPNQRGRAIGIYYVALAAGGGGSLILGGLLLQSLPAGLSVADWTFSPWRTLFFVAGLPGIFAALLMLTLRDPPRAGSIPGERASLAEFLGFVRLNWKPLGRISALSVLMTMAGYGAAAWAPALFERRFQVMPASSGLMIGLVFIVGSIVGPLIGGWISDRGITRGQSDARSRVMLIGYLALFPASFWSIVPSQNVALALLTLVIFCVGVVQSAMPLALQEFVPSTMRGQIIALQLMIVGLLSFGLGPTLVAVLTDSLFGSPEMLPWSLFCVALPTAIIGSVFGLTTGRGSTTPVSGDAALGRP